MMQAVEASIAASPRPREREPTRTKGLTQKPLAPALRDEHVALPDDANLELERSVIELAKVHGIKALLHTAVAERGCVRHCAAQVQREAQVAAGCALCPSRCRGAASWWAKPVST